VNKEGSATQGKVIDLDRYRRGQRRQSRPDASVDRPEKLEARAFVDLFSNGRVKYGVLGADVENAMSLLEPMLLIGHRLVLIAAE
jgi:hypothetical protein